MRRKLIGAFLAVALLVAATSGMASTLMSGVQDTYDRLLARQAAVSERIADIQSLAERQQGLLYGYMLKPDADSERELRDANGRLGREIDALAADRAGDDEGISRMKESNQTFARLVEKVVSYVRENKPDLARTEAGMWAVPTSAQLAESAASVSAREKERLASAKADNEANVRLLLQASIGFSVLAVGLAVLIGWTLSRTIVRPVKRLVEAADAIAQGDLTGSAIAVRTKDELRKLADAFHSMKEGLRDILRQAGRSAGRVAEETGRLRIRSGHVGEWSEHIASVVAEIAAGAEAQRDSVLRGAAGMDRMAVSAGEIEEASRIVLSRSAEAHAATDEGQSFMEQVLRQMGLIGRGMEGLASAVQRLSGRAEQIDRIARSIAAIARQTNMLALNASIEASRAGVYGKSFGVVAEEIRKLSLQTSAAAEEVGAMVENIQFEMGEVEKSTSSGSREVSAGLAIVRQAGDAFGRIGESVREAFRQAEEMTARSEMLSRLARDAAEAMEGIREVSERAAAGTLGVKETVVKQNAALEEMAASAERLAREAEELQARISRFRIGEQPAAFE
ncbi:methyl-accepting chemotaxis protein [Cohnella caldifontis]|uniref:methyl-accepting chemotaxis protein n=1 Tax=Cohnella caldifontis TaxID=3027471 RepID=UPI0023EBB0D9|nr:methyl-accepting chemotaxis protein [Cohnella sp. YIM B05605]